MERLESLKILFIKKEPEAGIQAYLIKDWQTDLIGIKDYLIEILKGLIQATSLNKTEVSIY